MFFIGGTNHGRWDGGIPQEGAPYYQIPTFDLRGVRNFHTEVYHRCDGYWRHERLSDEEFKQAVEEFERANPTRTRSPRLLPRARWRT